MGLDWLTAVGVVARSRISTLPVWSARIWLRSLSLARRPEISSAEPPLLWRSAIWVWRSSIACCTVAWSASLRLSVNCSAQAFARIAARLGSAALTVMSAMFVSPEEPTLTSPSSSPARSAGIPATRATRAATEFETISLTLVAASRWGSALPVKTDEPGSSWASRKSTLAVAA